MEKDVELQMGTGFIWGCICMYIYIHICDNFSKYGAPKRYP